MIKVRLCKAGKLIILPVCQGQGSLLTMAEKGSDLAIKDIIVFVRNRISYGCTNLKSLGS
jgi:hypothetical protein